MPLLEVGRVVKPHGLRGEVVVELVTNRLERLAPGTVLTLSPSSATAGGRSRAEDARVGAGQVVVTAARPHKGRFLVTFEGVADIDAAERLRGSTLLAEPVEDPEALFVHELIGAEVVEVSGRRHGRVAAVEANPASDLLVLEGGGLVPLTFVVGREGRRLVVDVPEGLLE